MASTANVQFIVDTDKKTTVKCVYFTTDGTQEASALKVNVATLKARVWTLTVNVAAVNATAQLGFTPGEKFTTNDANVGYVVDYTRAANVGTLRVVGANGATTFASAANLTSNATALSVGIDAAAGGTPLVSIAGLSYSISPGGVMQVQWGGTTNSDAVILTGTGYMGKNELSAPVLNNNGAATGNLIISTYGLANNGGYTVVFELHKVRGWSSKPGY